MLNKVLAALSNLRTNVVIEEYDLQAAVAAEFKKAGIGFAKEYRLGPRNRIDFLAEGGIGIETKKAKPNRSQVIAQLERYAKSLEISAMILVIERNMDLPREINGKPCISFGLNKLWGIAL